MRTLALVMVAAGFASCTRSQPYYSVPEQHQRLDRSTRLSSFVHAWAQSADAHFIKDVNPSSGEPWRWTSEEPVFRFGVRSVKQQKFRLELGVNEHTVNNAGPLRIVVLVNGYEIGRETYPTPGDHVFERPVPASVLKPDSENRVVVRVLNPWQAADGTKLGFVFRAAGFVSA